MHSIIKMIEDATGYDVYPVIKRLERSKATDQEIANSIKVKVKLVRQILYKLQEYRVVSYDRCRDEDTGWYRHHWKVHLDKSAAFFKKIILQKIESIRKNINYEEDNIFYMCPEGKERYTFVDASDNDFICENCNIPLLHKDNYERIFELEMKELQLRNRLAKL